MKDQDLVKAALTAAELCGVEVRREPLEGSGGGLCRMRGRRVLFIDAGADAATQLNCCVEALATMPELDRQCLRADLRELIDRRLNSSDLRSL